MRIIMFLLALTFVFVACESSKGETADGMGMENPVITYETAEEALAAVNFDAKLILNIPDGYVFDSASVIDDGLLQIHFASADSSINYRTANTQDDITGVYITFPDTQTITIGDTDVLLMTTGEQVNIATWNVDGIAYSLYFEQPEGIIVPMDQIELMISSVLE